MATPTSCASGSTRRWASSSLKERKTKIRTVYGLKHPGYLFGAIVAHPVTVA